MKTCLLHLTAILLAAFAPNVTATPRYVDASSATPASPYLSWSTAARTIQEAIDVAAPGDEVVVTNGSYASGGRAVYGYGTLTNRVVIDKALTVRSVNGPQFTFIQGYLAPGTVFGSSAIRCVFLANGASLAGFTLSNGATLSSGNAMLELSGGGVWCSSTNAIVSHCVIAGNHARVQGGGAYGGTLNNCVLFGNSATNAGATFSNVLNNCTVAGNTALLGVGGAHSATLNNCIVYFNTGQYPGNYAQCTLNYCDTTPLPAAGSDNLSSDPLFSDPAGGNLRLQSNSPCINAGNNAYTPAGLDLDGNARIFNSTVDLGAYEYQGVAAQVAPYILAQPTNQTVTIGSNATFTVVAGGTLPLHYQWASNTVALAGATNTSLMVTNAQLTHSGTLYAVTITNIAGSITSSNALLTVNPVSIVAPYITVHPTNQTVAVGGNATFAVWAFGTEPLRYQWRSNTINLAGATNSFYSITNVSLAHSGSVYSVTVTNVADSVTSSNALLSVISPPVFAPVITVQPTNQFAAVGSVVFFAVGATGTPPLSYQWNLDGATPAWATGAWVVLTNVQLAQAGNYFVTISNVAGSVVSSNAVLTVGLPPLAGTHYVNAANPTPIPPYTNWATAAQTIQEAVDAAVAGDEIVVTNGLYATGGRPVYGGLVNRVVADKAVSIRSVNGPEFTVIQGWQVPGTTNGDGAIRCVHLAAGASLSGFTLTHGATLNTGDARTLYGGGVWCESSNAVLAHCILAGNAANLFGGAVYSGTLTNCTLVGNSATYGGGACSSTLRSCTLTGNTAASGGGAMWASLDTCVLSTNTASSSGGGAEGCDLDHCTLAGNVASEGGGVGGGGTLNNCLLIGNWAGRGGGVAGGVLNNCTLVGNSATNSGGGAYGYYTFHVKLLSLLNNCIVYDNFAPQGTNSDGSTQYNCCMPDDCCVVSFGNITGEPRFVARENGDFRLQSASPCIDTGNNAYASGTTDLEGNPRITGGTVDIGAYEYQVAQPALGIAFSGESVLLTWPAWASGFELQQVGAAPGNAGGWSNLNTTPSVTNNINAVTLPVDDAFRLFRLYKP